ncbi:MAG: hypothetical protein A3G34_09550 [Candidatus Lindowbacteria bacterium RIFCSPLOWO2_12_FULL_62_27]|nr:MAG: hypothetical protein A3G34_09550 [Candidatus Lindowbacteria bacterium RIFCSPLOWO2_12_FULL_62_27]OGH61494.1 MAG: hypothetical protein A3I06_02540 [Candidatus Lindowbacteria bacterium RIFCSPLOWO2_02_FULL_62_12]
MQILYRYIFHRAAVASLFVVTTCVVIASLINLFDILDEVVKQNVGLDILFRYLGINCAPRMMDLLNVMMILAGLFTMGELGRRLELVSMRAAGLSDGRLLQPVVWLAGILFVVILGGSLEAIPKLQKEGDRLKGILRTGKVMEPQAAPFFVQMGGTALQASGYWPDRREMLQVRLVRFEGDRVSEIHQAERLIRSGRQWDLVAGVYRKMDPPTGQVMKYEPFARKPFPAGYATPEELLFEMRNRKNMVSWMSFTQLMSERTFLARQEIHKRVALAMSTAIGLCVGAWFGVKMQRFNAARAICLAILIGFAYRLIFDGCLALGVELGASWVCHGANLILIGVAPFSRFLTAT